MWSTVCHQAALAQVSSYMAFVHVPFVKNVYVDIVNTLKMIITIVKNNSICPHHYISSLVSTLLNLFHNHYSLCHQLVTLSVTVHIKTHPLFCYLMSTAALHPIIRTAQIIFYFTSRKCFRSNIILISLKSIQPHCNLYAKTTHISLNGTGTYSYTLFNWSDVKLTKNKARCGSAENEPGLSSLRV